MIAGNVIEHIAEREVRFLTLTVRTEGLTLTESLDKIYSAFVEVRRIEAWRKAVTGGVAFLEIKWNEGKQRWHPHFHCLIEGTWIDAKLIRAAWFKITHDSTNVDVREAPNKTNVARYITKYASKPFNNSFLNQADRLDEAVVALKGRRLAMTFGAWRGLKLTEVPTDGAWEHVASLTTVINRAANGDVECGAIMKALTNANLDELYARAPPWDAPTERKPNLDTQSNWFGTWQHDGTYKYPND